MKAEGQQRLLPALREALLEVVGPQGLIEDPEAMRPYLAEQRGRYRGRTPFILRPASTTEVSCIVKLCAEAGVAMVPQGGNTSLVAGSIPHEQGEEVLINLGRSEERRVGKEWRFGSGRQH